MEIERHYDGSLTVSYGNSDSQSVLDDSEPIDGDGVGNNLVELVHYLKHLQDTPRSNPEWAKFDTAATMSDNNGGIIYF